MMSPLLSNAPDDEIMFTEVYHEETNRWIATYYLGETDQYAILTHYTDGQAFIFKVNEENKIEIVAW